MKFRTLVLCDDAWHPAEVIQQGLNKLADSRFDFEYVPHGSRWSYAMMREFPLVVVAKANHLCASDQTPWLTPQTQSVFRDFVRQGGGLFFIHAGTCYKDLPEMRQVIGGAFLSHADQCSVTLEPKKGHPMTSGIDSFSGDDEHYFMALDDPHAEVFLQSHSKHGHQPAGWTRTEGRGRVCVLTPGHNVEIWVQPVYQKLLLNALCWTAKPH